VDGKGDGAREDDASVEGGEERGGEYGEEGGREGKDGEEGITFAEDGLLAAANSRWTNSRWHDTMDVPITATDLSALLMMRASSSSLLPV